MLRQIAKSLIAVAAVVTLAPPGARAENVLDLTTAGASGPINNAFFQQVDPQTTGTGAIDSFVRIQNTGDEQGYNTDGTPQFDTKGGAFTHSIQTSSLQAFDINGTANTAGAYFRFLLDINQMKSQSILDLNRLQIYLASSGSLTDLDPDASSLTGGTKIFDMDAGSTVNGTSDWSVKLDFSLNPGSGGGDMFLYVQKSLFSDSTRPYVYLFSDFSMANDGFEEWAASTGTPGIAFGTPEPSTMALALSGFGALGFAGLRRLRNRPSGR